MDRPAHIGEQLRRVDLRAQRAGIRQDDRAGDRLEGGAEMLHRFDRDGRIGLDIADGPDLDWDVALFYRRHVRALAAYFWQWAPPPTDRPRRITRRALGALSTTPASVALSRDLRKRGWTFVGPTTIYAFMQAMGLVNDHLEGCDVRAAVSEARKRFERP